MDAMIKIVIIIYVNLVNHILFIMVIIVNVDMILDIDYNIIQLDVKSVKFKIVKIVMIINIAIHVQMGTKCYSSNWKHINIKIYVLKNVLKDIIHIWDGVNNVHNIV